MSRNKQIEQLFTSLDWTKKFKEDGGEVIIIGRGLKKLLETNDCHINLYMFIKFPDSYKDKSISKYISKDIDIIGIFGHKSIRSQNNNLNKNIHLNILTTNPDSNIWSVPHIMGVMSMFHHKSTDDTENNIDTNDDFPLILYLNILDHNLEIKELEVVLKEEIDDVFSRWSKYITITSELQNIQWSLVHK